MHGENRIFDKPDRLACALGLGILLLSLSGCTPAALDQTEYTADEPAALLGEQPTERVEQEADRQELYRFVVLSDSHADESVFPAVLEQAVGENPVEILHLGDLTRVGALSELERAKEVLDESGFTVKAIPGDHDIARGGGNDWFEQAVGPAWQSFDHAPYRFLMLDNSDLEQGFGPEQWAWLERELTGVERVFLFMHHPPSHPWLAFSTMEATEAAQADAERLASLLADKVQVQVFSGDLHLFFTVGWETDVAGATGIPVTGVGAAGTDRNPRGPGYVRVIVYNDAAFELEFVPLNAGE